MNDGYRIKCAPYWFKEWLIFFSFYSNVLGEELWQCNAFFLPLYAGLKAKSNFFVSFMGRWCNPFVAMGVLPLGLIGERRNVDVAGAVLLYLKVTEWLTFLLMIFCKIPTPK